MNIEPGKYYRTRCGAKAYVAAKCPDGMGKVDFPFIGWLIDDDGDAYDATWRGDGVYVHGCTQHRDDLVAEWHDPVSVECDVLLMDAGDGYRAYCLNDGEVAHTCGLIARHRIRITEGKGIEVIE